MSAAGDDVTGAAAAGAGAAALVDMVFGGGSPAAGVREAGRPIVSVTGAGAAVIALGPRASQPSGSAANFVRHPGLQKK